MKEPKLLDMIQAAEKKKRSLDVESEIADMIDLEAITEQDFVDATVKIVGSPNTIDTNHRPLYAALNLAYHGKPSSVTIEAQGSPPPLRVIVDGLQDGPNAYYCREVYVNGKRLLTRRDKHEMVCTVVDCFLRSPAFVDCLARNDKADRNNAIKAEVKGNDVE